MTPANRQVRLAELAQWLRDGRIVAREHIVPGSIADSPTSS
jgi:hypothetical protein